MMKSIILVLSLVLANFSFADVQESNADKAADMFDKRGYDADGIDNVRKAIDLYETAIGETSDAVARLTLQNDQANAYYFLGSALTDKKERQLAYKNGMDEAEEVMGEMGVTDSHKLTDDQIDTLKGKFSDAEVTVLTTAMYQKGINLAQWGKLEGIATSIGRIGEVLGNMERVEKFGKEAMSHYGPYRTIGRVKFTLPVIFGGDLAESEAKLKAAFKNTLATDADGNQLKYSVNGYNNVYLAETLHKQGKEDQAKAIIKAFIQADKGTLAPDVIPENEKALEEANKLAADWKIAL